MPVSTVFVVDDDVAVRTALSRSLRLHGHEVEAYDSAVSFLQSMSPDRAGCVILDVAMPTMDGLELQNELRTQGIELPIIFVTGHANVPMTARAMKNGAVDFLEKPYRIDVLLQSVDQALARDRGLRSSQGQVSEIRVRYALLTAREREVMEQMVAGDASHTSKEIARALGISHRTVHEHRARIMSKMQASSVTALATMAGFCQTSD